MADCHGAVGAAGEPVASANQGDLEAIEETLGGGREWLEENEKATKQEITKKKKEVEREISKLMAKLFK